MAKFQFLIAALAAASSLLGVVAHPGEVHTAEKLKKAIATRDLATAHSKRAAQACASNSKHEALQARAAVRRSMAAQILRQKRDIVHKRMVSTRDQVALDDWLNTCHDQGEYLDYDRSTAETTIFASNATSALTPETIVGPYFVAGEYIRSEIAEGQAGIPIHLDMQFIDIDTCEPIPNMLVDVWHSNATGIYSGVEGQGGLNSTFLRGVQLTNYDGVTEFDSIYPGHYMGRTNHIHVLSHRGGKILSNGTYSGGTVNHIGQLYFDEELNEIIEGYQAYLQNTAARTTNRGDFLTADEATEDYDPFVDYVRLSEDANDGLLMWITIGVNTTADYTALAMEAAHLYKEGGQSNAPPFPANFSGFPGGFPTSLPSGFPSGFPFPGPTATPVATGIQPWGPCLKKRDGDE